LCRNATGIRSAAGASGGRRATAPRRVASSAAGAAPWAFGYAGLVTAPPSVVRWAFERGDGNERLEVVVDGRGLRVQLGEAPARHVWWRDVTAVTWPAPNQAIVVTASDGTLDLPFDLEGEGGDFDDLARLVVSRVGAGRDGPKTAGPFGVFRAGRLAGWAAAAIAGTGLAVALVDGRTHWIVGAALCALWLTTVRYAGLARECRLSVAGERLVLHRPWGRSTWPLAALSRVEVLRVGRPGARSLVLEVGERGGRRVVVESLGAEVFEAALAIRAAAGSRGDADGDATR
jgi:hypothetical protein